MSDEPQIITEPTPITRPIALAADTGASLTLQANGETVWMTTHLPHGQITTYSARVEFAEAVAKLRFDIVDRDALPAPTEVIEPRIWFGGDPVGLDLSHETPGTLRGRATRLLAAALWMERQK